MSSTPFAERLPAAMDAAKSLICVGLDPQPARTRADDIFEFNASVIEATADLVCAYKPQSAFYEVAGNVGWQALKETITLIRQAAPAAVVILDAKRNDIGNTAEAYASSAFDWFDADAVTINPYLGGDAVGPFLERAERGAFALCRTSNPGAADLQSLPMADGAPLYLAVADQARRWGESHHRNLGLVVGATWPEELADVRARCPRDADPAARDRRAGRRPGGIGRCRCRCGWARVAGLGFSIGHICRLCGRGARRGAGSSRCCQCRKSRERNVVSAEAEADSGERAERVPEQVGERA